MVNLAVADLVRRQGAGEEAQEGCQQCMRRCCCGQGSAGILQSGELLRG